MERKILQNKSLKAYTIVLTILFIVGVIGHIGEQTKDLMLAITPQFLLIVSVFAIVLSIQASQKFYQNKSLKLVFSAIFASFWYVVTFLMEVGGANNGWFFGAYQYSDILGVQLWSVPLIIGLNWVCVSFGAIYLSKLIVRAFIKLLKKTNMGFTKADSENEQLVDADSQHLGIVKLLALSILAGILVTIFDIALEPVAIGLNYWQWAGIDIPLSNYITWFLLGFCIAASYIVFNRFTDLKLRLEYFGILAVVEFIFFLCLLIFVV